MASRPEARGWRAAGQQAHELIDRWIADPRTVIRAADEANLSAEVAAATAEATDRLLLFREYLSLAVVDRDGQRLWEDARFESWTEGVSLDRDTIDAVVANGGSRSEQAGSVLLAYVRAADARAWPLGEAPLAAIADPRSAALVLAISTIHSARPKAVARAWGLTPMESRLATALVRTGQLREAAREAGLSYETAREALKSCLRRTGAKRQAGFVSLLGRPATGASEEAWAELALRDQYGLSPRDARLCVLVGSGLTRAQAARLAGVSEAATKEALSRAFERLGVRTAPELTRATLEAAAASVVARACGGSLLLHGDDEPFRIVPRPGGGAIAVTDTGPASGAPVLFLHTAATTRHPPRRLVRALGAAGFRVIAIDRPGFGLTDLRGTGTQPFEDAAEDMREVCDALKLERVAILSRGGAAAAVAFARLAPNRLGRVVLVNPDAPHRGPPPRAIVGALQHVLSGAKEDLIKRLGTLLATQGTPDRVRQLLRLSLRGSPADLAVLEDEEVVEDYLQSVAMLANGRLEGFNREHRAYAAGQPLPRVERSVDWTILSGAHDPICSPADREAWWRIPAPDARFECLDDGGRFLHLSHTDRVIAGLRG